jgi:membrane-associated protein
VFDQFTDFVADASGWAYLVVFAIAVIDAVFPLVPSETTVITAGVIAAGGDLILPLVIACAAAGAFVGDNTAYWLGRRFGQRLRKRFARSEKSQRRFGWAEQQLTERGGEIIVVARFIPGGRTAVTVVAGVLEYPWRRFALFDVTAALVWASYAALLGYYGGHAFDEDSWKGLVLALGLAFALTLVTEAVLRLIRRKRARR